MKSPFDHWSSYWAQANLTSLPEGFSACYDGSIAAFWASACKLVPARGRVLDICTGNGAVALLMAEYFSDNENIEIFASDAASIFPRQATDSVNRYRQFVNRIQFVEQTKTEAIAFEPESFNLITSQYGFEYTDWKQSATKICELLAGGGYFVMIHHSKESALFESISREIEAYRQLIATGILNCLQDFVTGQTGVNFFRKEIEKIHGEINSSSTYSKIQLFSFVRLSLSDLLSWDDSRIEKSRTEIAAFVETLESGARRAKQAFQINQKIASHPSWYDVLKAAGLKQLEFGRVANDRGLVAGEYAIFVKKT